MHDNPNMVSSVYFKTYLKGILGGKDCSFAPIKIYEKFK